MMSDMKATRLASTALASLLVLAAPVMVQAASAADNFESQRTDPGRHKQTNVQRQMNVQRHTAQRYEGRQRAARFDRERTTARSRQFTAQYDEREAMQPGYERQGYDRRAGQPNSEVGYYYADQAPYGGRGTYVYTNGYPGDGYGTAAYPPANGYYAQNGYTDPNWAQPQPVGAVANDVLNVATLGLLGNPYPPAPAYGYGYDAYGRPIAQPGWGQPGW
jgi:hypothetical protein